MLSALKGLTKVRGQHGVDVPAKQQAAEQLMAELQSAARSAHCETLVTAEGLRVSLAVVSARLWIQAERGQIYLKSGRSGAARIPVEGLAYDLASCRFEPRSIAVLAAAVAKQLNEQLPEELRST